MALVQNDVQIDVDEDNTKELTIDEEVKKELETASVGATSEALAKHKVKKGVIKSTIGCNQIHSPRLWKNSRRSRNGYGRGLPKKKGAGGKGVWGLPGSELLEVEEDYNDPNYDTQKMNNGTYLTSIAPDEANQEFKNKIEPAIREYFEHGESSAVSDAVLQFVPEKKRNVVVEKAIEIAVDHTKDSHKELTSILLAELCGDCISVQDITKAFENLLADLDDLKLDNPNAPIEIGNFIARSIADDCIPPKFIEQTREKSDGVNFLAAIERAEGLINRQHGMRLTDDVWGCGGPLRPVKYITKRMSLDLKEYIDSRDIREAARCLKQLEVPHFHHEYVYEAIIMVLEINKDDVTTAICDLLRAFAQEVLIPKDQIERGFLRIYNDLPDIQKDVPYAYDILDRFVTSCSKAGILSEQTIVAMPCKGRKRNISEGDHFTRRDKIDARKLDDSRAKEE